jgi:CubicO group peptidase (beta-lactamase class C family)
MSSGAPQRPSMTDGLTAAGLERLHAVAGQHVGSDRVPGLVALVARGDQVHVEALGELTVGGAPVAGDSLFRIASTTKPITAAATLALVAEGLIALDEPVDRLLPELSGRRVLRKMDGPLDDTVPAARAITVRDLMTFTFGFGMAMEMFTSAAPWPVVEAAEALHLSTIGPPNPDEQPDPDTWIAGLGTLPLLAQPGERWLYNTGASVLGVLLARAAGQPFGDVLQSRVFAPLGMRDTALFATATGRLATAYRPTPAGLVVWDEPDGAWSHPPAFGDGAAGLVSTAADLLAFARMLLRGGAPVLPAGAARAMTTDQLTPAQKASGGLGPGFFSGRSWAFCQSVLDSGAFGWDGGLGSSWLVDPNHDLVMIVLTQRMFETPEAPKVHSDIQAAAFAALA